MDNRKKYRKNLTRSFKKEKKSLVKMGYGVSRQVQSKYSKPMPALRLERYRHSNGRMIRKPPYQISRAGGNVYIMVGGANMALKKRRPRPSYNPWSTV